MPEPVVVEVPGPVQRVRIPEGLTAPCEEPTLELVVWGDLLELVVLHQSALERCAARLRAVRRWSAEAD